MSRQKSKCREQVIVALPPPAVACARARRPIAVDLFAGVGGLSLGFEQAGFDVVAAVEYDPIHAVVHEYNFPKTAVLCADAANRERVNEATLRDAIRNGARNHGHNIDEWDGEIDVVFGGPPCQGFSTIGKRDVEDIRNSLVFHFARVVEILNPRYFVMENVPGIASGSHGEILTKLIERLRQARYTVCDPFIMNAKDYGVPQDRRRVILVGWRNDCASVEKPLALVNSVPKIGARGRRSKNSDNLLPMGPSVWDAIGDLPNVDRRNILFSKDECRIGNAELGRLAEKASAYAAILRGSACDLNDFSYRRTWDQSRLTNSKLTSHDAKIVKRFRDTAKGETEPKSRFHRLHPNGLCSTLRAGTGSERGAYTSPRPIHPNKPRVITVREAARLHSFPDWFRFHRTKWHGFRQVGNSVPPLLGRAIATVVLRALALVAVRPNGELRLGDSRILDANHARAAKHFGLPEKREPHYRRTQNTLVARVRSKRNVSKKNRAA